MSDAEVWAFVESQKNIQVATIGKDGTPHLTVLWFAMVDGKVVLETFTKSQKVKNLERDERITVLFEDGDVYEKLRGVSIRGRAELSQEPKRVHDLHMAVLRRNTEYDEQTLEAATSSMAGKKTAIIIHPDKIISWDHTKLNVSY
jgi:PPOX class probable F420-dependent enzyme